MRGYLESEELHELSEAFAAKRKPDPEQIWTAKCDASLPDASQPATARDYHAAGLWQDETFYALLVRHADARGNDLCLRDGTRSLTWRQLRLQVDALAEMLAGLGLVAGDRVSIWMGNRIEAVLTFLACARNGYACNPSLHRTYNSAEIRGLLERLSSRVLLTEPGWGADGAAADLDAVLADLPDLQRILRPDQLPGALSRPSVLPVWDDPGQRPLPRLHLRHDRRAEMRHAFRQHAARQCPRHGPRLEPWPGDRAADAEPAFASYRLGRGRPVAARRLHAGARRSAGGTARGSTG